MKGALTRVLASLTLAAALLPALPARAHGGGGKPEAKGTAEMDEGKPDYPKYVLEKIVVEGNDKTTTGTILHHVPFKKGDAFSPDDPRLAKARARLLVTGWFSDVAFALEKGSKKGRVVLRIKVQERTTLIVSNVVFGVSKITTYGGVKIDENNFLGRGLSLSGSVVIGKPHRGFAAEFFDPAIAGSRFAAGLELHYVSGIDFLGYDNVVAIYPGDHEQSYDKARIDYKRIGGSIFGAVTFFKSLKLTLKYRLERLTADLPIAATHTRRGVTSPIEFNILAGDSYLSALSASVTYDTRNDPFLPTSGLFFNLSVELSNPLIGSAYSYSKYVVMLDYYAKLPWNHVLKVGLLVGFITGEAPLFEKFYLGDLSDLIPGRVMGMALDARRSFNLLRTSINLMRYEDIAAKVYAEYTIPLYRSKQNVYGVDFFFTLGFFMLASADDLTSPDRGFSDVSPAPVDLTANLGFKLDTAVGFFEISVGKLLGLIPIEKELSLWR